MSGFIFNPPAAAAAPAPVAAAPAPAVAPMVSFIKPPDAVPAPEPAPIIQSVPAPAPAPVVADPGPVVTAPGPGRIVVWQETDPFNERQPDRLKIGVVLTEADESGRFEVHVLGDATVRGRLHANEVQAL